VGRRIETSPARVVDDGEESFDHEGWWSRHLDPRARVRDPRPAKARGRSRGGLAVGGCGHHRHEFEARLSGGPRA
jgi:hypothetical protein